MAREYNSEDFDVACLFGIQHHGIIKTGLLSGWWFLATPLKNRKINWDDNRNPILMGKTWQPNHQPVIIEKLGGIRNMVEPEKNIMTWESR